MQVLIKKSSLTLLTVLISYLCIELLSLVIYYSYKGELLSFSVSHKLLEETAAGSRKRSFENQRLVKYGKLHPYLGIGGAPGIADIGKDNAVKPRDPNVLKVVIVGGSVAYYQGVSKYASQALKDKLATISQFKNKKIEIRVLAFPSYKQPQQIISLMLSVLFIEKPDIVINLDGHNDIVDTHRNYDARVFYAYPNLWDGITAGIHTDHRQIRIIADIIDFREYQTSWATSLNGSYLKYSPTLLLVWELADGILENKINDARATYADERRKALKNDAVKGPFQKYPPERKSKIMANLWISGSQMLQKLSYSYGAEYFHFLQPIPDWPGGKVFTSDERALRLHEIANDNNNKVKWYKILLEESARLKQDNINFYSLVEVFRNEKRTVYTDICCHVNSRGKKILAESMGNAIAQYYNKQR